MPTCPPFGLFGYPEQIFSFLERYRRLASSVKASRRPSRRSFGPVGGLQAPCPGSP